MTRNQTKRHEIIANFLLFSLSLSPSLFSLRLLWWMCEISLHQNRYVQANNAPASAETREPMNNCCKFHAETIVELPSANIFYCITLKSRSNRNKNKFYKKRRDKRQEFHFQLTIWLRATLVCTHTHTMAFEILFAFFSLFRFFYPPSSVVTVVVGLLGDNRRQCRKQKSANLIN